MLFFAVYLVIAVVVLVSIINNSEGKLSLQNRGRGVVVCTETCVILIALHITGVLVDEIGQI